MLSRLALLLFATFLTGCANSPYVYHYVPGKTAILQDGIAYAPESAPSEVQTAIAAANEIAGLPYSYGGGHGPGPHTAYDCSGAASHVLMAIGKLDSPLPSKSLRKYGRSGPGKWISVHARRDHTFLVIAGLRFDTGYHGEEKGPRWSIKNRPGKGAVVRHPSGL